MSTGNADMNPYRQDLLRQDALLRPGCAPRSHRRLVGGARVTAGLMMAMAAGGAALPAHADTYGYGNGAPQGTDASALPAQAPQIELDCVNVPLLNIVRILRKESNAQIVVVGGKYQPVTLTLTASLTDALHYVAQSAGASVTRDANGVYTFRPEGSVDADSLAVDSGPAGAMDAGSGRGYTGQFGSSVPGDVIAPPANASADSAAEIPASAQHYERIVLQNVDPNYILIMLNDPTGFRHDDPLSNPINQSPMHTIDTTPRITGSGAPIQELNPYNSFNGPSQSSVPLPDNNHAGATATQANQFVASPFQGGGGFGGGVNGGFGNSGGSFNPFQGAANNLAQTNPGGIAGNANNPAANLRPQGVTSIVANEQDNSLIVRGTPEGIAELKQIISFLDRSPKQVQIKVEFVTANVADADSFGISWDLIPFPNVETSFNGLNQGTLGSQTGQSFLTYSQGNLVVQLQALLSSSKGKVIQAPLITTTNNTPAQIFFDTQIPYETTTTVAQGSGNAVSGSSVSFLDVPNRLSVTPRINGDDSVSLLLQPQFTSIGTASFSGGPPTTSTQSLQTYRTVANGDTMVLGGLVNKQTTQVVNEVPFLSKLPIIGSLFRSRNTNVSDSELLIFVTPTVLPPINSADVNPAGGGASAGADASSGINVGNVSP